MKLFNTLSQKNEEIDSSKKTISLYTCGPTVYDSAHIGNLRAYLNYDLLKRAIIAAGFIVKHAMNITDVDDKTIGRAKGDKTQFDKLTKEYEEKFWSDLAALNILKPEIVTHATSYIDKIIAFIKVLLEKGFAYKTADGSVYFSIDKFKDYGKLSRLDRKGLKVGARVNQDEYDKENPADFALWKAWEQSDGEIFWDPSTWLGASTDFGKGRPGWHIECSVMSQDVLGETIDIHAGGIDLMFPHHENEIAQSESKTGKQFAKIWFHNEHLLVDGKKMSKSLNNFYTLNDIEAKGFSPLDFRYFVLGAHYRSKINFTWKALEAAKNAREKLKRFAAENIGKEDDYYQDCVKQFYSKLFDDLNSSEALAVVWELIRDEKKSLGKKVATLLKLDKEILALGLSDTDTIPQEVIELAEKRKNAREHGDYAKSDELRKKILELGWNIDDLQSNNYRLLK